MYFDIQKGKIRNKELAKQTSEKVQYPFDIKFKNIHFLETKPDRFRLVTHYGITKEDAEQTLNVLKKMVN